MRSEYQMDLSDNVKHIFEQDLRGKEYIAARGLNPQIVKDRQHQCESCKREEMLPSVLRILESWRSIGAI